MGVETLPQVCRRLVDGGLEAGTPAAVIQSGTTAEQRIITGDLATIAQRAGAASIKAPATTVIGDVAALADILLPQGRPEVAAARLA